MRTQHNLNKGRTEEETQVAMESKIIEGKAWLPF